MKPSILVGTPCRLPLLPSRRRFLANPEIVDRLPFASIVSASRCIVPVLLAGPRAVAVSAEDAVGLGGGGEGGRGEGGGGDFQECEFVQVGYISSIHGIKGEVRVTPLTDFPEIRFCTPGIRWLKTRVSGKELISQVQLTGGRGHSGQKSWIVSFSGIDTMDKAKQIVGSTLLVRESDRPDLEEGEFYTRDLVGMRVALKESRTLVGMVTKVVNYGASDLLHVMLATEDSQDWGNLSEEPDLNSHVQHVWVPFVEAIVPDVDMDKREMLITPPKGLLELNLRPDTRPKKERRQLEWKERKKLERHLAVAKRKLAEMGQTHVLEGLRIGEKAQKNLLARQIINIDFKMLQHAIQSFNNPSKSFQEFGSVNSATSLKSPIRVSLEYLMNCASEEKEDSNYIFQKEGLQLLSKSKTAIVLIVNEEGNNREAIETNGVSKSSLSKFENVLLGCSKFWKVEEDKTAPLIVVSPAHLINSYEKCLQDNNYFGMNSEKVWFLEEVQLPIVSMPVDQNSSKILLKSLWELLEAPIGSGGFFRLLLSNNILAQLCEIGVEFVEVCSLNDRATGGHPLFFGLVSSLRADVGIKVFENSRGEEEFDIIFSMRLLNRIAGRVDKLQFLASPEQHVHFNQDRNELATRYPDAPNSYRFRCSIYDSLNNCSEDEICVMEIFE
ncbi:uncharacterized protein LOC122014708 [Zingiber officinale]|uniref:uncharacterized protein LOC122014708 n=1 Tax=Zingiber officinale TaxID=94328 RepID=UPI001C4DCB7A|nr:uncharacterized protein LOC122014708 [Zingiber officinale]